MARSFLPKAAVFVCSLVINLAVLWHFHNRSWIPSDDGQYAHVAERLLEGEVLHQDVEEPHTGAIHFVNATALSFFGKKLVSLRYPLVVITALQSCLVYFLFLRWGLVAACVAALVSNSLGWIQVGNPSPTLYGLFFTVLAIFALARLPRTFRWRLETVGFLVMMVFVFRQLSGIFTAMGVVTYLLAEAREAECRHSNLARFILVIFFIALFFYLLKATDGWGFVLFGLWPLLVLSYALRLVKISDRSTLLIVGKLLQGGLLALLPLAGYHLYHGSWKEWLLDSFYRAPLIARFPHLGETTYARYFLGGLLCLWQPHVSTFLNGVYWLTLLSAGAWNGMFFLDVLRNAKFKAVRHPLACVALFWALVAVLNHVTAYLYYTVGLSLLGILEVASKECRPWRVRCVGGGLVGLVCLGIYYHAGQPFIHPRGFNHTIQGRRVTLIRDESLARSGLWLDPAEQKIYGPLISFIEANTTAGQSIFVIPNNAEIYFLSGRKNPFPFWNISMHWLTGNDVEAIVERLGHEPPSFIIHEVKNVYNRTEPMETLLGFVRERFALRKEIGEFRIYRPR